MVEFIKAENLKCKRTFSKKLLLIAPLFMILFAIVTGRYFVENGYNWWYLIIFPGLITLTTALVNQNEENKLCYRAVFALPISLRKIWISKVLLICIYVAAASFIHLMGMILGKLFLQFSLSYNGASDDCGNISSDNCFDLANTDLFVPFQKIWSDGNNPAQCRRRNRS